MSGAPRHLVAEAKEPSGPAADRALARRRNGLDVRIYAASKIEAARWRSSNQKREFYPRHGNWLQPNYPKSARALRFWKSLRMLRTEAHDSGLNASVIR